MDTITHGIVGALIGKSLFAGHDVPAGTSQSASSQTLSSPTARAAITACTIGSMFPDMDIFAGPLARNPLAIMEWHRNYTHSLVLMPLWAMLLAAVSLPLARWMRWKPPSFAKLALIYAVGIASHIFLDVVTSFGTMAWSPLNHSRLAWDLLFILDLTFTGLALLPQLAAWCYREPQEFAWRAGIVYGAMTIGAFGAYVLAEAAGSGFPIWIVPIASALIAAVVFLPAAKHIGFSWSRASWCRVGLLSLCVYLSIAAVEHRKALASVEEFAASRHLQVQKFGALPLPPIFTHWAGVIRTPDGVWRITLHEPNGKIERTQLFVDQGQETYIAMAKQLSDVQLYLWFARFPVFRVFHDDNGHVRVDISDIAYFRDSGSGPRRIQRAAGFTFEVEFDASERVVKEGWSTKNP